MPMLVSVIIPVYNAECYVRKAVESAVDLPEVGEVVLVEDGSPDGTLTVCRELEAEYDRVRLFRHPGGENRGAGASRNVGIRKARCELIAFLDADDYYLPHRFKNDIEILKEHPDLDGVYGATGTRFYCEEAKEEYLSGPWKKLTTVSGPVPPEELWQVLMHRHPGYEGGFTTDAVTLRRRAFRKAGVFHEGLKLQQDTHLWKRLAIRCRLVAGVIDEPVAMRGIHDHNRLLDHDNRRSYTVPYWESLMQWGRQHQVDGPVMDVMRRKLLAARMRGSSTMEAFFRLGLFALRYPGLATSEYGFFDVQVLDRFGSRPVAVRVLSAKNRLMNLLFCGHQQMENGLSWSCQGGKKLND